MPERMRQEMRPTLLLTGSSGFVGSYLKDTLSSHYRIVELTRANGYDIGDYASLQKLSEPIDIIVHAAAAVDGDYEQLFRANVLGTLNICKLAAAKNVSHLVHLSSLFAIDHPQNGYFNKYGKTKKLSEEVVRAYCEEHDIDMTILRLTQLYDDAGKARQAQAMLYFFVDTIRQKGEIAVFGRANPLRNYLHIDDLCRIVVDTLVHKRVGTFNVLHPTDHTITEIAYMIFESVRKTPSITRLTEKPDIATVYLPQTNRYPMEGEPFVTLEEGIERILHHVD